MSDQIIVPETDELALIQDLSLIALVCDRLADEPRLPAHLHDDVRTMRHRALNSAERIRRLARQQNPGLAGRLGGRVS